MMMMYLFIFTFLPLFGLQNYKDFRNYTK